MAPPSTPPKRPSRPPTMEMVATEAGVSIAAVSYVLSGRVGRSAGVRPDTADRIRESAKKLGYAPPHRHTDRTRAKRVLLNLTNVADPWSQSLIAAVKYCLADLPVSVLVVADGDWQRAAGPHGPQVIFIDEIDQVPRNQVLLSRMVRRGERIVTVSRDLPARGFDVIRPADGEAIELALSYLLPRYGTVGYLAGPADEPDRDHRYDVFRTSVAELGGSPPEWMITTPADRSAFTAAARKLLQRRRRPRAILAYNDAAAIAAIHTAHQLRLRVPDDIAIMGTGDSDEAAHMQPPLTTTGIPDEFTRYARLIRDRVLGASHQCRVHEASWILLRTGSTA